MRNTRKLTEVLIEEAVASNVASQKWGKDMAESWHEANRDLLLFKEAAVKKMMEFEEQLRQFTTPLPNAFQNTTVASQSSSQSSSPTIMAE